GREAGIFGGEGGLARRVRYAVELGGELRDEGGERAEVDAALLDERRLLLRDVGKVEEELQVGVELLKRVLGRHQQGQNGHLQSLLGRRMPPVAVQLAQRAVSSAGGPVKKSQARRPPAAAGVPGTRPTPGPHP